MTALDSAHLLDRLLLPPGKAISLRKDLDPGDSDGFPHNTDSDALLQRDLERLESLQDRFYAQKSHALLIVLQGLDASGKDSVVKHVMSGLNPQGCDVHSFKQPSQEELGHDFMWRAWKALPARGMTGIFNRSYYEDVLVVRVHPELLRPEMRGDHLWRRRFNEINQFEQYLVDNDTVVLKFFLYISKREQKHRFLDRIDRADKNWKFQSADVRERGFFDAYLNAYEDVLNHTSTEAAPWYVVPADHKWFTRLAIARVIVARLDHLNPKYPSVTEAQAKELAEARKLLEAEPTPIDR